MAKVSKLSEEIANHKLESSKLEDLKGELEEEKLKSIEILKKLDAKLQRSEETVSKLNEEIANLKLESSKFEALKFELEEEKLKSKEIQKKFDGTVVTI